MREAQFRTALLLRRRSGRWLHQEGAAEPHDPVWRWIGIF